jgi:hypothetical protein
MSHPKHHTVRFHKWVDGLLKTSDHHFATMEDAMAFTSTMDADTVKVYDDQGQLVHQSEQPQQQSYA